MVGEGGCRVRRMFVAGLVLVLWPVRGALAQGGESCVRVGFGAWQPPLDWANAGHVDSISTAAVRTRRLRDSVYAGERGATSRDEMQWFVVRGVRQLLIYPSFWPAGVMITFDPVPPTHASDSARLLREAAAVDTLRGEAVALTADGSRAPSRSRAAVIRRRC